MHSNLMHVMYCIVLCFVVLSCLVLPGMVWYGMAWYSMACVYVRTHARMHVRMFAGNVLQHSTI